MSDASHIISSPADLQEQLITSLRCELEEYGGLLNLLERQQEAILSRNPDSVLEIVAQIDAQIERTHVRRKQREATMNDLARLSQLQGNATLNKLVPHFRAVLRPLIEALADEVNRLIAETKRRAQQNQMLLARSVELTQELLSHVNPRAVSKTYSARGRMKIQPAAGASRLVEKS